jgi:hypothetical protein
VGYGRQTAAKNGFVWSYSQMKDDPTTHATTKAGNIPPQLE